MYVATRNSNVQKNQTHAVVYVMATASALVLR
jgi:hypothetical protein